MENTKPAYTGTVLLAESERSLREIVGTRLATEGYRVVPVNGGEQALQVAARHEHDIDLLMADDRYPAAQILRMALGRIAQGRLSAAQGHLVSLLCRTERDF